MDDNIGAVTKITRSGDRTFFNALNPLADEYVEFAIDVDGFDVTTINSVDLMLVYTDKGRNYDPFQDKYVDSVFAPVLVRSVTTFPSTVKISGADVVSALNLNSVDDIEVGDSFNVTFPINTADGRRLTVALNSELCNQPAQPSFGGCNVQWVVTCPSNIPLGSYTASTTATSTDVDCANAVDLTDYKVDVTLTSPSAGVYRISDFFGGVYVKWYGACYGGAKNPASFIDVCNTLSFGFADMFGAGVNGSISRDAGTGIITYTWTNDFGDTGTTILTPK